MYVVTDTLSGANLVAKDANEVERAIEWFTTGNIGTFVAADEDEIDRLVNSLPFGGYSRHLGVRVDPQ